MSDKKIFKATRQEYGDNVVKYMNKNLPLNSSLKVGFDWGNTGAGARQLATAILKEVSNQTIARIYTTKYTNAVVKLLRKDNWTLTASEVQLWINENTEYSIEDEEAIAREKKIAQEAEEKRLELIKAREAKMAKIANERRERELEVLKEKEAQEQKAQEEKEARELKALREKEARELQIKKDREEREQKLKRDREARELEIKKEHEEQEKLAKKEALAKKQKPSSNVKKVTYDGDNVVETICKDLHIVSSELATILGVTAQTVKNWKLEDEMPRLARKAMEFYATENAVDNTAELEKCAKDLKTSNAEIDNLKAQIKNNQVDVLEYKAQIKNYRVDMSEYKEDISDYKENILELKEHSRNYKVEIEGYKDDLFNYKAEIEESKTYRQFIELMNIPALYKRYSTLDGVDKA